MLSQEEKTEIDAELEHARTNQAACIEALKIIQRHRRWVSDESLRELAEYLQMSPDTLDSVATFYSMIFRKPVGEHVVLICDGFACWITGYENMLEHLKKKLGIELGETTKDGKFTLLTIPCIGTCDAAPAMVVDRVIYGNLTPERIDEILDSYK
jgi:NADH-quinone oxidoreductase subunit E